MNENAVKILIADDEKTIRAGLFKIISEAMSVPIQISEAKNGQEAWDRIQQDRPDILITDIRMPKVDGIELMRFVSSLAIKPAMVVLSGYEEFAYARESIRHGVISYILKPVDRDELIKVLHRIIEEKQKQDRLREARLLALAMRGKTMEKNTVHQLIARGSYHIVKCLEPDASFVREAAGHHMAYLLEEQAHGTVLLVPEQHLTPFTAEIQDHILFAGISEVIRSEADIQICKAHADIACCARFFVQGTTLSRYDELACPEPHCNDNRTLDAVTVLIGTGDRPGIDRYLQALFTFDSENLFQNISAVYQLFSQIPLLLVTFHQYIESDPYLSMKSMLLRDTDRYSSLADLKKDLTDFILYVDINLNQKYAAYPFIEDALAYVARHFTEPITMAVVANHCSVNYTYFSEKFKLVVGQNFNDYLKQLRLEEAKRLLQQGLYKVYEVASRSGFGDVKYFMKAFKEATGLSPGEYQKRYNTL